MCASHIPKISMSQKTCPELIQQTHVMEAVTVVAHVVAHVIAHVLHVQFPTVPGPHALDAKRAILVKIYLPHIFWQS